jgi:quercetin dioxygenase-like cupin family protein
MKRTVMIVAGTLVVGFAIGTITTQTLMAQQAPVTRTTLQQKDIEGVAGKEFVMYVADIIPGGVAGRHSHPGPEVAYVVEGSLIVEPDGQTPLTLKKGDSFHNPAKAVHNAKNGSATEPAKVLVVMIGEKGAPLATPVK